MFSLLLVAAAQWQSRMLPAGLSFIWASSTGKRPCTTQAGSCLMPTELYDEKEVDWEVQFQGKVRVRQWKSKDAKVVGEKWKCTVFRGRLEGAWVRLVHEPGFMPLVKDNVTALKKIPVYSKLAAGTGNCADVGMFPINDKETCETAAAAMKLSDTSLEKIMLVPLPEGCHFFTGKRTTGLFLSTNPLNEGNGAQDSHQQICSTYNKPVQKCEPVPSEPKHHSHV